MSPAFDPVRTLARLGYPLDTTPAASYHPESATGSDSLDGVAIDGTAPVPLTDDQGRTVLNDRGQPILRPKGLEPQVLVARGLADKAAEARMFSYPDASGPIAGLAYTGGKLLNFDRGAPWDAQRVGDVYHPEFVDYATVAIGLNAAASGLAREQILAVEDFKARTSHYPKGTVFDTTYTHLPQVNVANTDLGFRLVETGAIGATVPTQP